ncbi:MAG: hypothetical protein JST00_26510 [Deltaproteobacteria bacterium]|nr:hypothetical protein [Deltaproteobacteria bacterium]
MASRSHVRRRVPSLGGAIAAFLVVIGSARSAAAEAPTLRVLDPSASCPTAAELHTAIVGHLGRDPFAEKNGPSVDVAVRGTPSLRAEITVTRGDPRDASHPRTRTIEGDSCGELVRAAALVAALAIEEDAKPAPPAAPAPPPPAAEPAEPAPPARPPAPEPLPERDAVTPASPGDSLRRASFVAVASAVTSVGLLPSPGPGVAGALRVRLAPELWISARAMHLLPARMPGDEFAMSMTTGGAGACWEPLGSDRVAAIACAHVMAGTLAVLDASVPMRDGDKGFAGATLSGGARARVAGPVAVEATLEGVVPFAHPTFLTASCPIAGFQQPFASVAFSLGAGVSIP